MPVSSRYRWWHRGSPCSARQSGSGAGVEQENSEIAIAASTGKSTGSVPRKALRLRSGDDGSRENRRHSESSAFATNSTPRRSGQAVLHPLTNHPRKQRQSFVDPCLGGLERSNLKQSTWQLVRQVAAQPPVATEGRFSVSQNHRMNRSRITGRGLSGNWRSGERCRLTLRRTLQRVMPRSTARLFGVFR